MTLRDLTQLDLCLAEMQKAFHQIATIQQKSELIRFHAALDQAKDILWGEFTRQSTGGNSHDKSPNSP